MSAFKNFLIQVAVLTGILVAAMFGVFTYVLHKPVTAPYLILFVWFIGITLLVHRALLRAGKKDAKKFVPVFMAASGIRMMASLVYLMIYLGATEGDAKIFVVSFVSLFMAYTALEVLAVLKALRRLDEEKQS